MTICDLHQNVLTYRPSIGVEGGRGGGKTVRTFPRFRSGRRRHTEVDMGFSHFHCARLAGNCTQWRAAWQPAHLHEAGCARENAGQLTGICQEGGAPWFLKRHVERMADRPPGSYGF